MDLDIKVKRDVIIQKKGIVFTKRAMVHTDNMQDGQAKKHLVMFSMGRHKIDSSSQCLLHRACNYKIMKTIPDYPDYAITKDGQVWSKRKRKWLKLRQQKDGHLQTALCNKLKDKYKSIHKLVLETFIGKCPDGMECCHNNGNPADNRLENLRWDTHKNNIKEANWNNRKGKNNGRAKLTEQQVKEILSLYIPRKITRQYLANKYNVSVRCIEGIIYKESWGHL